MVLRCSVFLLGVPRIQGPDGETIPLADKDAALLLMACRPARLSRNTILRLLWPRGTTEQASASLRQRIFRLGRACRGAVLINGDPPQLASAVDVDLLSAETKLLNDPDAVPGELLADLTFEELDEFSGWLAVERQAWRDTRQETLLSRVESLQSLGELTGAVAYARRLCRDDPTLERGAQALIRLLYMQGDSGGAMAAYDVFERHLEASIGVRPSAATQELRHLVGRSLLGRPKALVPRPLATLRPPILVGRDALVRQALVALRQRRPVLLVGEGGIGKTRLAQALLHDTDQLGDRLHPVAARPGDALTSYATLGRVLRKMASGAEAAARLTDQPSWVLAVLTRVQPEWGPEEPGPIDASRLAAAVRIFLASDASGLWLDDLHHADPASLDLLLSVCNGVPIPWLFTTRPDHLPLPLQSWLRAALPEHALQLVLPPFTVDEILSLLDTLGLPELKSRDWASRLHAHTAGNVLMLLETCAELAHLGATAGQAEGAAAAALPVPQTMGGLLLARMQSLTPAAQRLARLAAVVAAPMDAELAAAVLEQHPLDLVDAWQELSDAGVLAGGEFRHDLIAEAVRNVVPQSIAAALHSRVADALLARVEPAAGAVARHLQSALRFADAASWHERHARELKRRGLHASELQAWSAAQHCAVRAGLAELAFRLEADACDARLSVHGLPVGLAAAEDLAARASTPNQQLLAGLPLVRNSLLAGRFSAALPLAGRLVELAETLGDARSLLQARIGLAQAQSQASDPAQALLTLDGPGLPGTGPQGLRALAAGLGDTLLEYEFEAASGYVLALTGRRRQAVTASTRALELAAAMGMDAERVTTLSNRALLHYNLGQPLQARADVEEALALQAAAGDQRVVQVASAYIHLGVICYSLGDVQQALTHTKRALEDCATAGAVVWQRLAQINLATIYTFAGQYARAQYELVAAWGEGAAEVHLLRHRMLLARVSRLSGAAPSDDRAAVSALQMALERAGPRPTATTAQAWVELAWRLPAVEALERIDAGIALAERLEEVAVALWARSRRAAVLASQMPQQAMHDARLVLSELKTAWVNDHLPEAWWNCYQAFRAAGADDEAEALAQRACKHLNESVLPSTPMAFRPSLSERNPAVRGLLQAVSKAR